MRQTEIERIRTWERKYANEICPEWVEMDAVSWGAYFAHWKSKPSLHQTFDEMVENCPFFSRTAGSPATTSPRTSAERCVGRSPSQQTEQLALPLSSRGLSRGTPGELFRNLLQIRALSGA